MIEEKAGLCIYNLGTGTGYSVLDMVKNFEEANGVKADSSSWHDAGAQKHSKRMQREKHFNLSRCTLSLFYAGIRPLLSLSIDIR